MGKQRDYLSVFGATLSGGKFVLVALRKYLDGRSVFDEQIHSFKDPLQVSEFVNDRDSLARLILNVLDPHVFDTIVNVRTHRITDAREIESQAFLSKQIYLENHSDIGVMPNLKSDLVYHFQNLIGESLGVPPTLLKESIKIKFEIGDEGNLRPYWPGNARLSAVFEAMLTCLYPLELLSMRTPPEQREGIPSQMLELADTPLHQRAQKCAEWDDSCFSIKSAFAGSMEYEEF